MTTLKLWFTSSFAAAALATSMIALAQDEKPADKAPGSGPNPYTDCGIGAALFQKTKWAAVTSNVIWDLGLTAITSATASPQTCSGKTVAAALFIHHAYDKLVEETASGQGEHLTALLDIFECESSHHANAVRQIRDAMGRAVAAPKYVDQSHVDKASNFYSIAERVVSASCSA